MESDSQSRLTVNIMRLRTTAETSFSPLLRGFLQAEVGRQTKCGRYHFMGWSPGLNKKRKREQQLSSLSASCLQIQCDQLPKGPLWAKTHPSFFRWVFLGFCCCCCSLHNSKTSISGLGKGTIAVLSHQVFIILLGKGGYIFPFIYENSFHSQKPITDNHPLHIHYLWERESLILGGAIQNITKMEVFTVTLMLLGFQCLSW